MRQLAFVGLVLVLCALEATVPRVLLADWARPLLVVPLVFFASLKLSTFEGALLALLAGLAQEAAGGYPPGRSAFTLVALFVVARLVLSGVRVDGRVFSVAFCGGLTLGFHLVTLVLASVFEQLTTPVMQQPWLRAALWSALATMVAAVPVLALAGRINAIGARHSDFP